MKTQLDYATDIAIELLKEERDALAARLAETKRDARIVGVRWAIEAGYIGPQYAADALRAADSYEGTFA